MGASCSPFPAVYTRIWAILGIFYEDVLDPTRAPSFFRHRKTKRCPGPPLPNPDSSGTAGVPEGKPAYSSAAAGAKRLDAQLGGLQPRHGVCVAGQFDPGVLLPAEAEHQQFGRPAGDLDLGPLT